MVGASTALASLFNDGPARRALSSEQLHAPHLIDSEVASGLRRRVAAGHVTSESALAMLTAWRQLALTRYAVHPLLGRIWELRHKVSAYDAGYVALAEALGCALVTADARLASSAGPTCVITVIPR